MRSYTKNSIKKNMSDEFEIPVNAIKCTNCDSYDEYDNKCEKWECTLEDDPEDCCCRCFEPKE